MHRQRSSGDADSPFRILGRGGYSLHPLAPIQGHWGQRWNWPVRRCFTGVPSGARESAFGDGEQVEDVAGEVAGGVLLDLFTVQDLRFGQFLQSLACGGKADPEHPLGGAGSDERYLRQGVEELGCRRVGPWAVADSVSGAR